LHSQAYPPEPTPGIHELGQVMFVVKSLSTLSREQEEPQRFGAKFLSNGAKTPRTVKSGLKVTKFRHARHARATVRVSNATTERVVAINTHHPPVPSGLAWHLYWYAPTISSSPPYQQHNHIQSILSLQVRIDVACISRCTFSREVGHSQWPRRFSLSATNRWLTRSTDGRKERVQFDKITARVSRLCYGLDSEHVDPLAITMKVINGVYQGVTTIQLDDLVSFSDVLYLFAITNGNPGC
jgi:hypothetical protein